MEKAFKILSGLKATIVGGVFLAASLVVMLTKIDIVIDPAWITVVICGYPLLYLAVWRLLFNRGMSKISSALLISIAMIASIAIGELFAAGEVAFIMAIGDEVFCGTINRFGSIDIRTTKVGNDSSLQKLIRLVQEAENNKAPMQRIVDKWAAWLVPIALMIAIVTYFITWDIVRAVTILVVFCPCALALATPTSIMAAIAQATKHGVIIKSGEALENMGKVDIIAFDKTGTLTECRYCHGKYG